LPAPKPNFLTMVNACFLGCFFWKGNVKARYLESHKSFYKLSLKIYHIKVSTLICLMEKLNLKDELLNYYFH
jgi:hypothetical protein